MDDTLYKLINIYAENTTTFERFWKRMPIYSVRKLKKYQVASIKKKKQQHNNNRCNKNLIYTIAKEFSTNSK